MADTISPSELGEFLREACSLNSIGPDDPCPYVSVPRDQQKQIVFDDPESLVQADIAVVERIDFSSHVAGGILAVTLRLSKNGEPYYHPHDTSPDYDGFPDPHGTHEIIWSKDLPVVIANQSRGLLYSPDYPRRIVPALEGGFADVLSERRAGQLFAGLAHIL